MAKLKQWLPEPGMPEIGLATFEDGEEFYTPKDVLTKAGFDIPETDVPSTDVPDLRLAQSVPLPAAAGGTISPSQTSRRTVPESRADVYTGPITPGMQSVAPEDMTPEQAQSLYASEQVDQSKINMQPHITSRPKPAEKQGKPEDKERIPFLDEAYPQTAGATQQPPPTYESPFLGAANEAAASIQPTSGGKGRYVPTSTTTVTERGAPYDPNAAALRVEAKGQAIKTETDTLIEESDARQAQSLILKQKIRQLEQEEADKAAQDKADNDRYRRNEALMQGAVMQYTQDNKPDRDKIFKDKPFMELRFAIASALGAYGATLGGTENFAQKAIDRIIRQELDNQKKEYDEGIRTRENFLNRMIQDHGMSREEAQAAHAVAARRLTNMKIEQMAAETGSREVMARAKVIQAAGQRDIILDEDALIRAGKGKQKVTESEKFVQPGGISREEAFKRKVGIFKAAAEGEEALQTLTGRKKKEEMSDEVKLRYAQVIDAADAPLQTLSKLERNFAGQKERFGAIPGINYAASMVPDFLANPTLAAGSWMGSEAANAAIQNRNDLDKLVRDVIAAKNKGAASEGDVERMQKSVEGIKRGQDVERNVREMKETLQRTKDRLYAVNPEVAAELDQGMNELAAGRSTPTPRPKNKKEEE